MGLDVVAGALVYMDIRKPRKKGVLERENLVTGQPVINVVSSGGSQLCLV